MMVILIAFLLFSCFEFSLEEDCGITKRTGRITGGVEVERQKYPWFAMLRIKDFGESTPYCGGVLISPTHVLTAAHCVSFFTIPIDVDSLAVRIGIYDWCSGDEDNSFSVNKIYIHEKYDIVGKLILNDIAILELSRRASAPFVCLPKANSSNTSQPGRIVGFGLIDEEVYQSPCRLQEANITIYTREECLKSLHRPEDSNDPTKICAAATGKDSCKGDSGGPLLTFNSLGNFVVSGIVSFGHGCGRRNLPGIYTNVSSFLDWILETIKHDL